MKKRLLSGLLVAVMLASLLTGCGSGDGGEEITLVTNGTSEYVIVHSADATAAELNAAQELQEYLKDISGAEIEIVTDASKEVEKEIIVGETNREGWKEFNRKKLTEDGFIIKTADSKLWLVGGGDRGTLYSVYAFLEDYLGCGFYTQDTEVVPTKENITVAIAKDEQVPTFSVRGVRAPRTMNADYSAKRRFNLTLGGRDLSEEQGGGYDYVHGTGGHTYDAWVNAGEYFTSHPEYFGMDAHGNRMATYQPCLTNPDVIDLLIEGAKEWLAEEPEAEAISVSQLDHTNYCRCDDCMALYEENGGALSSAILHASNAVAKAIKDDYPNAVVHTFIYSYTRSVPTKIKPEDNVMIDFCTMGDCFGHANSKDDCGMRQAATYADGSSNTLMTDLNAWADICKEGQLKIYDYGSNFAYTALTFPDLGFLRENVQIYQEAGAFAVEYECALGTTASAEFLELKAYLLSKLLWDADMSEEEYYTHMDNFLNNVYGEGGKYIREYIELSEEYVGGLSGQQKGCFDLVTPIFDMYPVSSVTNHKDNELPEDLTVAMVKNYTSTDWSKYWNWYKDVKANPLSEEGVPLFEKAMELAEGETQQKNLTRASSQAYYLDSCTRYRQIEAGGQVDKLITKFMEKNAGSFTDAEKASLPKAIQNLAKEQVEKAYADYNQAFCKRMVSSGISSTGNVQLAGWTKFDFTLPPNEWG